MPSPKTAKPDSRKLDDLFSNESVGSPLVPCKSPAALTEEPFEEESIICSAICECDESCKFTGEKKGQCVKRILWSFDEACGYESTIKAEVPYMTVKNEDFDRLVKMGYTFDSPPPRHNL